MIISFVEGGAPKTAYSNPYRLHGSYPTASLRIQVSDHYAMGKPRTIYITCLLSIPAVLKTQANRVVPVPESLGSCFGTRHTMCSSEMDTASPSYPLRASKPVGKRIARLDKDRLAQLYSPGQWEKVNLLACVQRLEE